MHMGHPLYPLTCCPETNPNAGKSCIVHKRIERNTKFLLPTAFDMSKAGTPSQSFSMSRMRGRMNISNASPEGLFSPATGQNSSEGALRAWIKQPLNVLIPSQEVLSKTATSISSYVDVIFEITSPPSTNETHDICNTA
jgi:hypothetical protein